MTGGHTEWQVGVSLEAVSAPSLSWNVMLRQCLSKCGLRGRLEAPRPFVQGDFEDSWCGFTSV